MTFETRVYNQEFKLNDTDDSIIAYIKEHRREIADISIQSIAGELFVSPNSIMRLARKLGYSGFSELKFSLQQENNPADVNTVEQHVLSKIPQNIIKSLDVLDEAIVRKLVDMMIEAENILFVGIGDSVYFCELFGRYLRCLNKKVEYYQQIHDIEYAARYSKKGDLILIISASGKPERLVRLAEMVKERGCILYCITHYGENPLSEVCGNQICFWGEERIVDGYNVTDRSGLMMVIRLICEAFWKRFCV